MTAPTPAPDEPVHLPVVEERLHVGRETVSTGALRVDVKPQQRLQTLDLDATHDDVEIERVAVNREVDAPRAPWQDGDVLVVPVYEETLVLRKQLVLKEELRLHRRRHTRHWQQDVVLLHDTVNLQRRAADGSWAPAPGPVGAGPPADGPQTGSPDGTTAVSPEP